MIANTLPFLDFLIILFIKPHHTFSYFFHAIFINYFLILFLINIVFFQAKRKIVKVLSRGIDDHYMDCL
ncbi:MAG: hypothetical protein C0591_03075 [Marinilabiliales bacterium]|nr:MAG: hypothetical protein C0591_03075 [Marinilabiliales bacterium]